MATSKLKTDSPLSRSIVTAFMDFLTSVEPGPGVDLEGLEVAKECLADVFKINPSVDTKEKDNLLVSLFRSREVTEQQECKSHIIHENSSADAPSTSMAPQASHANNAGASQTLGEDLTGEAPALGVSEDELFGQFFGALERIRYFKRTSDGHDDQDQLDRISLFFNNAVMELKKSGSQMVDAKNLAETFKSQGNKSLQSKQYSDAIELYTYAIALCEDNAVYYCNRAAAYTQIHKYGEAIRDSLKSIESDPNYGKAYSRLGFAYYAQGNYRDAIDKGFLRALQLDPNNDSIKENIRAAEQKLREQARNQHYQSYSYSNSGAHQETGQQSAGGSRNETTHPLFTSVPGLPPDFTNMFMNMASNFPQGPFLQEGQQAPSQGNTFNEPEVRSGSNININVGQQAPSHGNTFSEPEVRSDGNININLGQQEPSHGNTFGEPEVRSAGNININLGEQMPEEISGALRSVMQMFSGTMPHVNPQDNNTNEGSPPS